MKPIRAIIPAAGKGRRLQRISGDLPKAMFPVAGKPILTFVLDNISFIEQSNTYIVVGCGRGKDLKGESMIVAYRRDCFDMISMETFWLSTAPSVPGSSYGVDQSSCPRCTTAVVLKHDSAEQPFLFLKTHLDHKGAQARLFGAIQILQYVSDKKLPFVLTGDMNARPEAAEIQAFVNCKSHAVVDITSGIQGTFHGFGTRPTMSKIDYIFTDMESDPAESYAYNDVPVEGLYVSDHLPVFGFVTVG